jgi:hypothetical protein
MSVIKLNKPINSVKELVDSKEIKLLIQGQTGLADRYLVIIIENNNIALNMGKRF